MQSLKGSDCTVLRARLYVAAHAHKTHTRTHTHTHQSPNTTRLHPTAPPTPSPRSSFMKQRPKILHFSGRGVGGGRVSSGLEGLAVDAGIQLADGVLASRDFSAVDLSRCVVVVLSCSWVSVEDVCGLPALASAMMTAGAGAVVAATCNIPAMARQVFLEAL